MVESFVEFAPISLTDASAASLRTRFEDPAGNFGGLNVIGVGRFIADYLPVGIAGDELPVVADHLAEQVGANVSGSIIDWYNQRMERA